MFTLIETFTLIHCADCGIAFGITSDFEDRRRKDHVAFKCPNGHPNAYLQETVEEKLKRQLEAEKIRAENAERLRRQTQVQFYSAKGQLTKFQNRVSKGVCPKCNRHLSDLFQHMESKHKEAEVKK